MIQGKCHKIQSHQLRFIVFGLLDKEKKVETTTLCEQNLNKVCYTPLLLSKYQHD